MTNGPLSTLSKCAAILGPVSLLISPSLTTSAKLQDAVHPSGTFASDEVPGGDADQGHGAASGDQNSILQTNSGSRDRMQ